MRMSSEVGLARGDFFVRIKIVLRKSDFPVDFKTTQGKKRIRCGVAK
jgi:hypothetical protein